MPKQRRRNQRPRRRNHRRRGRRMMRSPRKKAGPRRRTTRMTAPQSSPSKQASSPSLGLLATRRSTQRRRQEHGRIGRQHVLQPSGSRVVSLHPPLGGGGWRTTTCTMVTWQQGEMAGGGPARGKAAMARQGEGPAMARQGKGRLRPRLGGGWDSAAAGDSNSITRSDYESCGLDTG